MANARLLERLLPAMAAEAGISVAELRELMIPVDMDTSQRRAYAACDLLAGILIAVRRCHATAHTIPIPKKVDCAYTTTYSRLVVRTSSHSLFVRVRALFVRVRVRCSRVVRTLLVRCSYAARTSSHERELTRELRDAPL